MTVPLDEPEEDDEPEPELEDDPDPELEDEPDPEEDDEPDPELEDEPDPDDEEEPDPELEDDPEPDDEEEPDPELEDEPEPEDEEEPSQSHPSIISWTLYFIWTHHRGSPFSSVHVILEDTRPFTSAGNTECDVSLWMPAGIGQSVWEQRSSTEGESGM